MTYHASIELMEAWWIGHVHELPGCFTQARTLDACRAALPQAVADYAAWLAAHGEPADVSRDADIAVDEVIRAWWSASDFEVNAFFAADSVLLSAAEVVRATRLLACTRADLLASIAGLSGEQLSQPVEDGWSIRDILSHVGGAEWWYLDRLHLAAPQDAVPHDPFERLNATREQLLATLPRLAGSAQLECRDYEVWSPRKVLRRAIWHERDHTAHILRFRARLPAGAPPA